MKVNYVGPEFCYRLTYFLARRIVPDSLGAQANIVPVTNSVIAFHIFAHFMSRLAQKLYLTAEDGILASRLLILVVRHEKLHADTLSCFIGGFGSCTLASGLQQRKVACVVSSREYTAVGNKDLSTPLKNGLASLRPFLP